MHVRNIFVLVSGNDVPQLSKGALVVEESQTPVRFPLFCPFSFPHVVTGQGIGSQAEDAAMLVEETQLTSWPDQSQIWKPS